MIFRCMLQTLCANAMQVGMPLHGLHGDVTCDPPEGVAEAPSGAPES